MQLLEQVTIPRVEALPSQPNFWEIIQFNKKAHSLHKWLYTADGGAVPGVDIAFNYTLSSRWYNGSIASMPSYLGGGIDGAGEALAVVGTVYGSAVIGKRSSDFIVPAEFITTFADPNGIVWNNPPGLAPVTVSTFWYGLMNSFMMYSSLDLLKLDIRHEMLAAAAKQWSAAVEVMGGSFNHTGFDFGKMQPFDNGQWTEADAAASVALLGVWAAHDAGQPRPRTQADPTARADALALADTALRFLERQTKSPLYECVMPQGVLAAARMNALAGANKYNVSQMLEFALSDGDNQYRSGWGMLGAGLSLSLSDSVCRHPLGRARRRRSDRLAHRRRRLRLPRQRPVVAGGLVARPPLRPAVQPRYRQVDVQPGQRCALLLRGHAGGFRAAVQPGRPLGLLERSWLRGAAQVRLQPNGGEMSARRRVWPFRDWRLVRGSELY